MAIFHSGLVVNGGASNRLLRAGAAPPPFMNQPVCISGEFHHLANSHDASRSLVASAMALETGPKFWLLLGCFGQRKTPKLRSGLLSGYFWILLEPISHI